MKIYIKMSVLNINTVEISTGQKVNVQTFKLYLQCIFLKNDSNEKIYKSHKINQ